MSDFTQLILRQMSNRNLPKHSDTLHRQPKVPIQIARTCENPILHQCPILLPIILFARFLIGNPLNLQPIPDPETDIQNPVKSCKNLDDDLS